MIRPAAASAACFPRTAALAACLAYTVALAACLACTAALAEEGDALTGTMRTVQARGTLRIGVREESVPFSFRNRAGQPVGFSVDICRTIAADIARHLNRDLLEPGAPDWENGLRMQFVPVSAAARLPSLVDGTIDLECGSTTANDERRRTVAFSPVFFLAGTKLLAAPAVQSYRDLAGRSIAVSTGTTNATVIRRLAPTLAPPFEIVETADLNAAYDLLASGKVQAVASDDILLAGLVATHPDGRRFAVIGDYLSFEPYAIALRRDDPAMSDAVRTSFERIAADGSLATGYRRWFTEQLPTGQTLALPMSAELTEMYRALGQPD